MAAANVVNILAKGTVHPFPARMAPELVATKIASLDDGAVVLDPMMGSGTFPVCASMAGLTAIGFDTDPLAVLIAQTVSSSYGLDAYVSVAEHVAASAAARVGEVDIEVDAETSAFIDYWFDSLTRSRLSALACEIKAADSVFHAPLWCAFSRLIVSKDASVSRARDVSHSRPHRVRELALFDPIAKFVSAARAIRNRVDSVRVNRSNDAQPLLCRADARNLPLLDSSVDAVMTSPPYLVAIDYLRGHRLSLVWMGYSLSYLRRLRSGNVGAEAGLAAVSEKLTAISSRAVDREVSSRAAGLIRRYVYDVNNLMCEIDRVLRGSGQASFVIADATFQGVKVSIETIFGGVAQLNNLTLAARTTRALPSNRRYLPPPAGGANPLDGRMKEEVVMVFKRC